MVQGDPRRAKMARRKAGTDRLARLSPTESLQNQKLLQSICTGTADIFFCRPRREGWGLQTLARFRISGGGGGHFSGEFLDEVLSVRDVVRQRGTKAKMNVSTENIHFVD